MRNLIGLCAGLMFLSSCYYDNAAEMYPLAGLNTNCDTVDVTWTKNIQPLFINNCGANNSCHSASIADGGVILDSYSGAVLADESKLIGCSEQADGFIPMPPSGRLSDCGVNQIKLWIQNGKPQ